MRCSKQLLPAILFYLNLRFIVRRIAAQKRAQALKASFVKIKGNDIVATTKIFYSLVWVPTLIAVYSLLFGLYTRLWLGRSWGTAAGSAAWMSLLLPVYLFICLTVSYDFKKYAKRSVAQLRMRLLDRNSQTLNFKDLLREKLEIESGLLNTIRTHKEEIKEILEHQITSRDLKEELTAEKIEAILNDV